MSRDLIPLFGALCALFFVAQVNWRPAQFAVIAEIKTDAPARIQLRYNRGYGNRQEGISTKILKASGEFIRVRFPVEVNSAQDLRLVNLGFGSSLDLRSLTLKPLGGPARSLTAADLSPNTPDPINTQISQVGDIIHVESSGTEPLVLHISRGARLPASRTALLLQWIFVVPLAGAALALVCALRQKRKVPPDCSHPAGVPDARRSRLRMAVIGTLLFGYFAFSFPGLNGSSTALWRYYADREMPDAGVLLGSPKEVRSDEWMLQTPWIFSQALRTPAFSPSNPNIGSDVTPLVTNLPVHHWSTLFRPQMWPFFLMNSERAFAFYWNFKSFALLLGALLFFGVLTGGKTLLDLAGALFLTFSPFVQWWLSTPTCLPEMLAMFFFAGWLSAILYRGRVRWQIAAAAVGLIIAIENFIFCCYPRFQVPLIYLAAALLLGGLISSKARNDFRPFRLACIGFIIAAVAVATWLWWRDVAEIVRITSLLSYPGQIRFRGGGFEWNRFFDPFLEFSMTGDHFPERLENACEAAGFLFLTPFLAVRVIRDAVRGKADWMLIMPLAVVGLTIFYMSVGVPMWAAKASGWAFVYPGRANLLVGVGTAIALIRYLACSKAEQLTTLTRLCIFGGCFLLLLPLLKLTNVRLGHFENSSTVIATALFVAAIALCIWMRSAVGTCLLLVVPQFYACALVNPIAQGVPAITQSPLLHWLAEAQKNAPEGKWIVLGDTLRAQLLPNFIKAAGFDVLGGTRCSPDYAMMQILDPAKQFVALWDRYAWIRFKQANVDAPVLEATPELAYDIKMPLSADLLDRLGVKHVLQVDMPTDEVPPGFHLIGIHAQCRLLERD